MDDEAEKSQQTADYKFINDNCGDFFHKRAFYYYFICVLLFCSGHIVVTVLKLLSIYLFYTPSSNGLKLTCNSVELNQPHWGKYCELCIFSDRIFILYFLFYLPNHLGLCSFSAASQRIWFQGCFAKDKRKYLVSLALKILYFLSKAFSNVLFEPGLMCLCCTSVSCVKVLGQQ